MSSLGEQKDKLERLLENCEDEKVRLAERNAKLTASGKVLEIIGPSIQIHACTYGFNHSQYKIRRFGNSMQT